MQPLYDGVLRSVFARNCEIKRINKPEASAFLNQYHRFGDAACKYRYGIYVLRSTGVREFAVPAGTLVAVAEFSGARRWLKNDKTISSYEWVRYASLPYLSVVGGMGKVLRHFIDEMHPDDIMSYVVPEWSDGSVYRSLGFVQEESKTFPDGSTSLKFRLRLTAY